MFCRGTAARHLPDLKELRPVIVGKNETRRFSCGHVGLKGELGKRVLERIASAPSLASRFVAPDNDILDLLEGKFSH